MKKPVPGSKNYTKRYAKWHRKEDRKERNEWTFWELVKSIFQRRQR